MVVPVFSKCCCGCSLRTGSLIIGYFGIVGCIIGILLAIFGISGLPLIGAVLKQSWLTYYAAVLALNILISGMQFIFNSILIVGTYKRNVKYLRIFVIWATILVVVIPVIAMLSFLIIDIYAGISNLIGLFYQGFSILIVRSFYLELESTPGRGDVFPGQAPQGQVSQVSQPNPDPLPYTAPRIYYSAPQPVYQNEIQFYPVNPIITKTDTETMQNEELPPTNG